MKRLIKFRGRSFNGELYYGELQWIDDEAHHELHETEVEKRWLTIYTGDYHVHVIPDTVAQFVGYDKNGKEVYEGDTLIDESDEEYIARIYDPPQCISSLLLKE